jgi:tetratricopeptide (TPR) repeat protein
MKRPSIFNTALRVLIFALFLPWAEAQQQNTGQTNPDTSPPKTVPKIPPATLPPIMSPNTQQGQRQQQQQNQELIIVSGSVVMEDGTPPPFGTQIERDCGVSVITETVVNINGHYDFQVGAKDRFGRIFADASEGAEQDPFDRDLAGLGSGGLMDSYLIRPTPLSLRLLGCELRAKLSGYKSSVVRFDGGPRTGLIEVGTIVLYPISRVKGAMVSATNLLAPKDAKKALSQARKEQKKKDFSTAEKSLKAAVASYPAYAEAWLELGRLYQGQKRNEDARNALAKSIEADKYYLDPYISLAQLAAKEKRWRDVADTTDQVLALDPTVFPEGYFLNSLAYYNLDKPDLAEKTARRALRMGLNKQIPGIHLVLANIYARKNDRVGFTEELRNYLRLAPNAPDAEAVRALVQEGERTAKAAVKAARDPTDK